MKDSILKAAAFKGFLGMLGLRFSHCPRQFVSYHIECGTVTGKGSILGCGLKNFLLEWLWVNLPIDTRGELPLL
jgi:hypothetical protein